MEIAKLIRQSVEFVKEDETKLISLIGWYITHYPEYANEFVVELKSLGLEKYLYIIDVKINNLLSDIVFSSKPYCYSFMRYITSNDINILKSIINQAKRLLHPRDKIIAELKKTLPQYLKHFEEVLFNPWDKIYTSLRNKGTSEDISKMLDKEHAFEQYTSLLKSVANSVDNNKFNEICALSTKYYADRIRQDSACGPIRPMVQPESFKNSRINKKNAEHISSSRPRRSKRWNNIYETNGRINRRKLSLSPDNNSFKFSSEQHTDNIMKSLSYINNNNNSINNNDNDIKISFGAEQQSKVQQSKVQLNDVRLNFDALSLDSDELYQKVATYLSVEGKEIKSILKPYQDNVPNLLVQLETASKLKELNAKLIDKKCLIEALEELIGDVNCAKFLDCVEASTKLNKDLF